MARTALYPGSFDPLTNGHVSIIERGLRVFDRVTVALAINIRKSPVFSLDERKAFIRSAFPDTDRVIIEDLDGLLVHEARRLGCDAILRGLRNASDFDYELAMTTMNRQLAPEIETVFLMTEEDHFYVSSSLVKEVARFGGDIEQFVPADVAKALVAKLSASE